jgi:hypothetical protein
VVEKREQSDDREYGGEHKAERALRGSLDLFLARKIFMGVLRALAACRHLPTSLPRSLTHVYSPYKQFPGPKKVQHRDDDALADAKV